MGETNEGYVHELNELGLADTLPQHLTGSRSPTSPQSQDTISTIKPVRPANPRVPTSQDDVSLSSMRSRRLLSGYMFGNPPVPADVAVENEHPELRDSGRSPSGIQSAILPADVPQPPPTPSTVVSGHEEELEPAKSSPSNVEEPIENDDALMGFLDGEADADERARAVQAEHGGSQGYMRKEEGEAGEYRFPTHRLKRHMKGELPHLAGISDDVC